MEKDKLDRPRSIFGQIVPREQDNSMFGIEIITDEGSYSVELDDISEQLLDLLYQDIRATGVVFKNKNGSYRIALTDYEVIDTFGHCEN